MPRAHHALHGGHHGAHGLAHCPHGTREPVSGPERHVDARRSVWHGNPAWLAVAAVAPVCTAPCVFCCRVTYTFQFSPRLFCLPSVLRRPFAAPSAGARRRRFSLPVLPLCCPCAAPPCAAPPVLPRAQVAARGDVLLQKPREQGPPARVSLQRGGHGSRGRAPRARHRPMEVCAGSP